MLLLLRPAFAERLLSGSTFVSVVSINYLRHWKLIKREPDDLFNRPPLDPDQLYGAHNPSDRLDPSERCRPATCQGDITL